MKNKKSIAGIIILFMIVVLFSACKKKEYYSDDYAMKEVKLCTTNTNSVDFMKGFSMQGTIGELIDQEDIYSVAMCYTTANLEEVKKFFQSAPYNDPESFTAEIEALDLDGKIRNLTEDKKAYLDGAVDNPIRFYGDGIDLINGGSLLQNAGEYHFYLVTLGYEKALWVGEADKTFTMEQAAIDTANEFKKAFEVIQEATLLPDRDAASITQEEKTAAAKEYYTGLVDELMLDIATEVVYGEDESYPDDYEVTLKKGEVSSTTYVTVHFGKVTDPNAELYDIILLSSDASNKDDQMMKGFQLGFRSNAELVTGDNTKGYIMFYSTSDLAAVTTALADLSYADIEELDTAGKVKLITDLTYADGAGNTYYSDAVDLISGTSLIDTAGEYHFYTATLSSDDNNVVRYIGEADTTFTK